MNHERVTGSLREDLEMAELDMRSDPKRWRNAWGKMMPHEDTYAGRWNLWPEAFAAFLDYQSPARWHKDFVKGAS